MTQKNKTSESLKLHQLENALTTNVDNPQQIKATIQKACSWAQFFEDRAGLFIMDKETRCLEVSYQIAHIAIIEMSLGLSAIIAAILTPSFIAGCTSLEATTKHFGEETASILTELVNFNSHAIQCNTIDQYAHYTDASTPAVVAILLHVCNIIRLYYNELVVDQQGEALNTASKELLSELKYFYMPLVHRIRLYDIQTKLADLWLKHTDTINYYAITAQLGSTKLEREKQLGFIAEEVDAVMRKHGVHCMIKKRIKSLYAIWHKMKKLQVNFNQIHDLTAIRIIVLDTNNKTFPEEKIICWKILTILSNLYKPLYTIMRDWISTPKNNGYESLHLAFETRSYGELEVQIRTKRMDYIAEHGKAAHWKYKYNE